MKMEPQVVSFDLSNQLEEMDLPQTGIFAWYRYENQKPYVNLKDFQNYIENENLIRDGDIVSPNMICDALTVAELGEMLPEGHWESGRVSIDKIYFCAYVIDSEAPEDHIDEVNYGNTEADARAKMWIRLKKEKIIK